MHRTDIKDEKGDIWHVFHNSDWSGEVHIRRRGNETEPVFRVPGFILKNAAREVAVEELRGRLEDVLDDVSSPASRARRPVQRQDSVADQLRDLYTLANRRGMYDAADALLRLMR
jgi:hypothetical protein